MAIAHGRQTPEPGHPYGRGWRARAGQSMIELVVAIYVILTALVAVASLVTTSMRRQVSTEEGVMMYNLTRESLEASRLLRDNAFTTGTRPTTCTTPCTTLPSGQSSSDHNGVTTLDPTTGQWILDYSASDGVFNDTANPSAGKVMCLQNGIYFQRLAGCPANTATPYQRRLTVDFICLNPSDNTECVTTSGTGCPGGCAAGYTQFIGHRVTARVYRRFRGCNTTNGCVYLEDYLYAWK